MQETAGTQAGGGRFIEQPLASRKSFWEGHGFSHAAGSVKTAGL
jgi:hypothetical protein